MNYPPPYPGTSKPAPAYPGANTASPSYPKKPPYPKTASRKVKLFNSGAARTKYDSLATFYSIIKTVELLDHAFLNNNVEAAEYEKAVTKLIGQHKAQQLALKKTGAIQNTHVEFIEKYGMSCSLASRRLDVGIPITKEHDTDGGNDRNLGSIFAVAGLIITTLDNLKLGERSVEALHPDIRDIVGAVKDFPQLECKKKLTTWLIELNKMKASDEITEEQSTQLAFDVQWTYDEIQTFLTKKP